MCHKDSECKCSSCSPVFSNILKSHLVYPDCDGFPRNASHYNLSQEISLPVCGLFINRNSFIKRKSGRLYHNKGQMDSLKSFTYLEHCLRVFNSLSIPQESKSLQSIPKHHAHTCSSICMLLDSGKESRGKPV